MAAGRHLRALNRSLRATGAGDDPVQAPLVELARTLARELDASPAGGLSGRLLAAYRSALRELSRVRRPVRAVAAPPNELDRFRARRGVAT